MSSHSVRLDTFPHAHNLIARQFLQFAEVLCLINGIGDSNIDFGCAVRAFDVVGICCGER